MSNTFFDLPIPPGVGVGAPVDVSAIGVNKTLIISGAFTAGVVIEASEDGTNFAQVKSYGTPGAFLMPVVANALRVRVTNLPVNGLLPTAIGVGGEDRTVLSGQLDISAVDGAGTPLDSSAFGPVQSFITVV